MLATGQFRISSGIYTLKYTKENYFASILDDHEYWWKHRACLFRD